MQTAINDNNQSGRKETPPVEVGVHIRSEILQLKGLTANEKIVLSAVIQLYLSNGKCFASNPFYSRWLGIPQKTIEDTIKYLIRKNLMTRKIEYNGKQVKRRFLTPNLKRLRLKKKTMKGVSRKSGHPLLKIGEDNRE